MFDTAASALCNVGGTKRHVDRALVGLAPLGSRARALLTPPADRDAEWFVDERPGHFARLLDCLRHGPTALDFMKPYHAAIVRSLLSAPHDHAVSSVCVPNTATATIARDRRRAPIALRGDSQKGDDAGAKDMCAVMRLVLDDGTPMDVARSTLCRVPPRSKPVFHSDCADAWGAPDADSILARIASADHRWRPPTIDGRLYIAQSARHFGLLLDCQRHGISIIEHITSAYKLWGLRALGTYYGLDGLVDAVQIAIGRHLYKAKPACKVEIEVMDHTVFSKTDGTEWHIKSQSGPRGKVALASNTMKYSEIAALARAAVGAPDYVGVYADPCAGDWNLLCAGDARPYAKRDFSLFTGKGHSRVYVDRYPVDDPDRTPVDGVASPVGYPSVDRTDTLSDENVAVDDRKASCKRTPSLRYALVVVFDMVHERARNFGVLAFDASNGAVSTGEALVRACARRDPDAFTWQHIVAVSRRSYDNYTAIDVDEPLTRDLCYGGAIWVAHGKPGVTGYGVVRLDIPISPL
ncbi:hypothetical protein pkur_cds_649 [Pandoravirus kuranda]|uniref:BTB/POZ domain containing protein n=1 Tax=Pandoravirus kuranda TaxID=3019033 RepID=A0AA95EH62_9VIRU|nr:hypothetical protein pkur_cds_649 [Pandoravirus kuranda]